MVERRQRKREMEVKGGREKKAESATQDKVEAVSMLPSIDWQT